MTETVTTGSTDAGQMSLMEHLVELRTRLIRCAIAIAVGAAVGWLLYNPIVDFLSKPLTELAQGNKNVRDNFLSTDPLEGFMTRLKMSTYIGFAVAMPVVLWQLWKFVSPGLYKNERRYASMFVASATALFALGAAIAYFTLLPALTFLQGVGSDKLVYEYSLTKYVTLVVYMMLAFGMGFQFPIVLVFLQLIGILTPQQLRDFRRFGVVIIFVVAAVITPSADPISLFALAVPMIIFYEISIIIGRIVRRRRARAEAT